MQTGYFIFIVQAKYFCTLFNPHNDAVTQTLLLSPFYRQEHWQARSLTRSYSQEVAEPGLESTRLVQTAECEAGWPYAGLAEEDLTVYDGIWIDEPKTLGVSWPPCILLGRWGSDTQ